MGLRKLLGNRSGRYSIWQDVLAEPEPHPHPQPQPQSLPKVSSEKVHFSFKKTQVTTSTQTQGQSQGQGQGQSQTPTDLAGLGTSIPNTGPAELESVASEGKTLQWDIRKKTRGAVEVGEGVAVEVEGRQALNVEGEGEEGIENGDSDKENDDDGKVSGGTIQHPHEEEEEEEEPPAKEKPKPVVDDDLLIFSDMMDAIPLFGRQFGVAPTSIVREQKAQEPEPEPEPEPESKSKSVNGQGKDFDSLLQQVDQELEALYADHLKQSGTRKAEKPKGFGGHDWTASYESAVKSRKKLKSAFRSKPEPKAEECIICLEPFKDGVPAPKTVTSACLHPPSVCSDCVKKSIKNDLETKFWNEIKCPECKTLLIHDDVKRFADEATFARYDNLSFRHAVSADKRFIWCLECDFGQLHEPGASQPQVRCLNCAAVSCFKHAIKWHDGFTCDEYDAVLWDPDSYREIKAKNANGGSAEPTLQPMSEAVMKRAKLGEEFRQQQLHQAQKKAAREQQAKAMKEAKKAKQAKEKEEKSSKQASAKDDFQEKLETLKRRKEELEASVKVVEATTKRCPGCRWPIEKNEGCDHMTCKNPPDCLPASFYCVHYLVVIGD
ncbi:E3 ubiquitin-protein ligase [Aspergillus lucknowensis]|uniref:RBR-type E3 ubiquitin transferase n=1 Tax=Aspergillus lucknowensis TaxID=176173 RepID=A0ABR4LXI1_9EURO